MSAMTVVMGFALKEARMDRREDRCFLFDGIMARMIWLSVVVTSRAMKHECNINRISSFAMY